MTERLLLTISQACDLLSMGRTKFLELVYAGEIESLTVGRRRYVRRAELDAFVARRQEAEREAVVG